MVQNQSNMYSAFKDSLAIIDRKDEKITSNSETKQTDILANSFAKSQLNSNPLELTFNNTISLCTKQNKLIEIGLNLTETSQFVLDESEHSVSQIGDYQFWRDRDNIAVVNARSSELIAYGDHRDLLPERITPDEIENSSSNSTNLFDKIKQEHPTIKTNYQLSSVTPALDKLKPLDPLIRASNPSSNQPQKINNLSQSLSKIVHERLDKISHNAKQTKTWLNDTFDSITQQIQQKSTQSQQKVENFLNSRVQKTASQVLTKHLVKQTLQKYWSGRKRTGESEYSIGDYKINRDETGKYKLKNKQGELITTFRYNYDRKNQRSQVRVLSHTLDPKKVFQALKTVRDPHLSAVGSPEKETIYQNKLDNLVKQISQRVNGTSTLGKEQYLVDKERKNITLKSPQGATLISANSQGVNSQISLNKIKQIHQTLREEKQQKRVETIAPLLVDYLNLNRTSKISKANFSIEYNSNDQTLTFENHKNPSELLKAQLKDDKWLDQGSSISQSEESRFTERVAPKLKKAFLELQHQHQPTRPKTHTKSQARSL